MKIAAVCSVLIVVIVAAVAVPTNDRIFNRVDDAPGSSAGARPTPQGDTNRYIIVYKNVEGLNQVRSNATQVHVELTDLKAVAVTILPEAVARLQNDPNIELIEQDVPRFLAGSFRSLSSSKPKTNHDTNNTISTRSLMDEGQHTPYGIKLIQADQVPMGSSFVPKICIIDTGYDLGHEDLPGEPQVTGDSESIAGNWFEDGNSHGTHVAGTIAALNNDKGVVGVCPNCQLHILRTLDDNGNAYSSDLIAATSKCRDAGANIISMSIGGFAETLCEKMAFRTLYKTNNILLVASAGNDGNATLSFPATYKTVISVGALDDKRVVASFSQRNSGVVISAPGVGVISTVRMGSGFEVSLTAGGSSYEARNMLGSMTNVLQAPLFDCGIGDTSCVGATGKICLIQRAEIRFFVQVDHCIVVGGIGVIVYNNEPGLESVSLFDSFFSFKATAVFVSDETGRALSLVEQTGTVITLSVTTSNYDIYDGTSMAAPHVSGVAGLIWSYNATKSAQEIRKALVSTAKPLGARGKDESYGFGMVRACKAAQKLGASLRCRKPSIFL